MSQSVTNTKRKANGTPGRGQQKVPRNDESEISDSEMNLKSPIVTMDILKSVIGEALQPLVSEVSSMRSELSILQSLSNDVSELRTRVGDIESQMIEKVDARIDSRMSRDLSQKVDRLVREHEMSLCKRQAMILNLPNATNRQGLRDFLTKCGEGIQSLRVFTTKANRTMASVRFCDQQTRDAFVAKFREKTRVYKQDGKDYTLVIKNDQTESVRKRNGLIHSKVKELKESGIEHVSIDWKSRHICISGAPAFGQRHDSDDIYAIQ